MNLEILFYLLAAIVFIIISSIKGSQEKKKEDAQEFSSEDMTEPPTLRNYEDTEAFNEDLEANALVTEYNQIHGTETVKDREQTYDTEESIGGDNEIAGNKQVQSHKEPYSKTNKYKQQKKNTFNLRKAIIYQTIITRKYF